MRVSLDAVKQLAVQEAVLGEVACAPRGLDARKGTAASVGDEQGCALPAFPRLAL